MISITALRFHMLNNSANRELLKVVMRYTAGKLIKGYSNDFFLNKPVFRAQLIESQPADKSIEISLKELKAVFVVKDFTGNAAYKEKKYFGEGRHAPGRKVEVIFTDGEVLVGSSLNYDPAHPGFFVTPADPQSNNTRVLVVSTSVGKFRYLNASTSIGQHFQLADCADCGWHGKVSIYAGRCPKCNKSIGAQRANRRI
jgi:hypothetical protein